MSSDLSIDTELMEELNRERANKSSSRDSTPHPGHFVSTPRATELPIPTLGSETMTTNDGEKIYTVLSSLATRWKAMKDREEQDLLGGLRTDAQEGWLLAEEAKEEREKEKSEQKK